MSAPVGHEIDIGVNNLDRMDLIQDHQRAKQEKNIVKLTATYAPDTDIFEEEHDPRVTEDPRNRSSNAFIPSNIGNHVTVEHTAGYGSVSYMSLVLNTDLWRAPTMQMRRVRKTSSEFDLRKEFVSGSFTSVSGHPSELDSAHSTALTQRSTSPSAEEKMGDAYHFPDSPTCSLSPLPNTALPSPQSPMTRTRGRSSVASIVKRFESISPQQAFGPL